MKAVILNCQFNDCMHLNEDICGVKEAVNDNSISTERYLSYLNIVDSIEENKWG